MLRNGMHNNRRGGVLIVVAISLTVLIAMAALSIDIGQMYAAKQRAQNVCDAAALAGARYLDPNQFSASQAAVRIAANECAVANNNVAGFKCLKTGSTEEGVTISFPDTTTVRADADVNVEYGFAGVLGIASSRVHAHSVVKLKTSSRMSYPFAPLSIGETQVASLTFGQPQALKTDRWQEGLDVFIGPGNFAPLRFDGDSGSADYEGRLSGDRTDKITLAVGDFVQTEAGNMTGPTYRAAASRIAKDTAFTNNSTSWSQWSATWNPTTMTFAPTPRLIVIPVIRVPAGGINGASVPVEVVGFAGFFLEAAQEKNAAWGTGISETVQVQGRFVVGAVGTNAIHWLWWMGPDSTVNRVLAAPLVE